MALVKILLAEDDGDDQKLFIDFLQHRPEIEILPIMENGVDLIENLDGISEKEALPDLVILDQNMPKQNGLQTLILLKSTPRYAHIPVMVYSTYTDQNLIRQCNENGAFAVASKPISKEGYNQMIDELLGKMGKGIII
jgi:CheY-like chemotaxis protein